MTLVEFIMTYEGITDDGSKGIVANIPDYYSRYIGIADKKYKGRQLSLRSKVICPFHDDHDPSLGLISHRFYKGVGVYHCLGCGAAGTIIRFHQRVQKLFYNEVVNERDACFGLATLFNIPVDEYKEFDESDFEQKAVNTSNKIARLMKSYTVKDFSLELRDIRMSGGSPDLRRVNSAYVKMTATKKGLY